MLSVNSVSAKYGGENFFFLIAYVSGLLAVLFYVSWRALLPVLV